MASTRIRQVHHPRAPGGQARLPPPQGRAGGDLPRRDIPGRGDGARLPGGGRYRLALPGARSRPGGAGPTPTSSTRCSASSEPTLTTPRDLGAEIEFQLGDETHTFDTHHGRFHPQGAGALPLYPPARGPAIPLLVVFAMSGRYPEAGETARGARCRGRRHRGSGHRGSVRGHSLRRLVPGRYVLLVVFARDGGSARGCPGILA